VGKKSRINQRKAPGEGTNQTVTSRFESPEASWSDLEQRFFESAPPDEPQPVLAPMSFADLEPAVPEARAKTLRFRRAVPVDLGEDLLPPPTVARRLLEGMRRLPPAFRSAPARARHGAIAGWRLVRPALATARQRAGHLVRIAVERFFDGLPQDRPDRPTIVAVVSCLVVLVGLSAGVLASGRPILARPPVAEVQVVAPPAAPTPPLPSDLPRLP
jgi:hypothetical protein